MVNYISVILVAFVALQHVCFLVLEMFLWTKPSTRRIFDLSKEDAERASVFAANLGLYNGFLALGLVWGLLHPNTVFGEQIQLFFLICVFCAGVYGGLSSKRSLLFIQGFPALVAIVVRVLV